MSKNDNDNGKPSPNGNVVSLIEGEILIVDDTAESLRLLADMLRQEGYRVRPTPDPVLALKSALNSPPELILLDVKMPVMDGFELCQQLKQDQRTAAIPVIFVSALQEMRDRVRGFQVGGIDFITKPLQREEVLARVGTHLELARMRKNLSAVVEKKTHELALDEQRFEALYELSKMNDAGDHEPSAYALEAAVAMTRSEVGYLHFVNEDQQHIDLYQWSQRTMELCTAEPSEHYPMEGAGIWADCVRDGRPVIHNDYQHMETKRGLPEGHFPLYRHMSVPIYDKGKAVAIVGVGNKKEPYNDIDARQLSLFGNGMWSLIRQKRGDEQLRIALIQTIEAIANTVEQRDPYTAGHQRRVAQLACAIGREIGLEPNVIEGIHMGGMIHDIGKIHIPAEILNRPGKLSENEFAIIKSHSQVGFDIVKNVNFPWPVAEIVHQHHERLDGSGYPQHLSGDDICIEARVLAVADVVEAMATHRPYRPALSIEIALEEIEKGSGRIYEAQAVTACVKLFREQNYQLSSE